MQKTDKTAEKRIKTVKKRSESAENVVKPGKTVIKPDDNRLIATSYQLAGMLGISQRMVNELAKNGIITAVEGLRPAKYDLLATIPVYIRYHDDKRKAGSGESSKLAAEVRIKEAKAEEAELQLSEYKGEMHNAADVEDAINDLVYFVRGALMALPGRLAIDVANALNAAEVSQIVKKVTDKTLNDLSEYKYDPKKMSERMKRRMGALTMPDDEDED